MKSPREHTNRIAATEGERRRHDDPELEQIPESAEGRRESFVWRSPVGFQNGRAPWPLGGEEFAHSERTT